MKNFLQIGIFRKAFGTVTLLCLLLSTVQMSAQASLNYFEDFEGTNNWTFVNGTQANKWHVGSATSNGLGSKSLYISNNNGANNTYSTGSESVTYAYKEITIPVGTTNTTVSFDWKNDGGSGVAIW